MQKTELSKDIVVVTLEDKDGNEVTYTLHNFDAGHVQERTQDGDLERSWFCPRCHRTFVTPL